MIANIALAQMNASDNPAANLEKIVAFAEQASSQGADLLMLPEYAMGYPSSKDGHFPRAEPMNGAFVIGLRTLAKRHGMYLLCGILEHAEGLKPYNTLVLIDRKGEIVCKHRKNHMYETVRYRERDYFEMGDSIFTAADIDFARIGLVNCYEVRYPELIRLQALAGAEIILVCAAFTEGPSKLRQWHTLLSARAIENAVYVCGCDHVKPKVFVGGSGAYDPNGEPIVVMECEEGIRMVSCDLETVRKMRQTNASILHRRKELCGLTKESEL